MNKITSKEFGAIITPISLPDKNRNFDDVLLSFKIPEGCFNSNQYTYAAVAGRFANRFSNGKFSIYGKVFQVSKNEGNNHIHGDK